MLFSRASECSPAHAVSSAAPEETAAGKGENCCFTVEEADLLNTSCGRAQWGVN